MQEPSEGLGGPCQPPASDLPPDSPADASTNLRVLISGQQLQARVAELAEQIKADYGDKPILLVGILKGSVMLMADLSRQLGLNISMAWTTLSSYGDETTSSGVIRQIAELDTDVKDKHVLVVEDIIDTGLTLEWFLSRLRQQQPASVEVCVLLRKPKSQSVEVKYAGFDIPDEFVIGYGMDYAEKYRNLRSICVLEVGE